MPYIINRITLEDIKKSDPETIWYSFNTCWWTHRSADICTHPKHGLTCDPRGGMLLEIPAKDFIDNAESNPSHYGKHGLDAFMASHNDNCVVSYDDHRSTCLQTWDEYNHLLDYTSHKNLFEIMSLPIFENHELVDFIRKTDNEERRKPQPRKERDWEGFMKRRNNR